MSDLLTTSQAGEVLGVSRERVRQLIVAGALPAIKPGHDYLIARRDLQALERRPAGRPPRRTP